MKKLLVTFLSISAIAVLFFPATSYATTAIPWNITNLTDLFIFPSLVNGGTKGIIVSASSTIGSGTATGGLTVSGTASTTNLIVTSSQSSGCAQFSAKGSISSTGIACGSGGSGLSTSSPTASSNLLVYSSTGAGSAFGVATSTLTPSSPLTGSLIQIGSGGAIGCTTAASGVAGCLNSTDWATFNNKISSTSLSITTTGGSGASTYTPSTGVFNIPQYQAAGSGTSGNCVVWGASNALGDAGAPCGSGGGATFGNAFNFVSGTPNYLIGTTSPLGLIMTASSTIGNGTQAGGLTIAGGATTTGNVLFNLGGIASSTFAVGANGYTNPAFQIFASTSLDVTGLQVRTNIAGGGVSLLTTSSGANEPLSISSKGTSGVSINTATGAGNVVIQGLTLTTTGLSLSTQNWGTTNTPVNLIAQFAAGSNLTAATNVPYFKVGLLTSLSAANSVVPYQTDNYFTSNVHAFTSFAATNNYTNLATVGIEGPPRVLATGNGTTTLAIGLSIGSSSPSIEFNASTTATAALVVYPSGGATKNYDALFLGGGNVGIGTTSPYQVLSIGGDTVIGASTAGGTLGNLYIPTLGTAAGTFIAADPTGKLISTTSPTGSNSAFSPAANYATAAGLPSYTYSLGVITEVGTGALSVDGNSPSVGQRVLVKNESGACMSGSGACNNGLYDVTAAGSGIAAFVLTRDPQYNSSSNVIPGIVTYIISGATLADDFWALTSAAPITVGSTALNYTEVSGGGASVTSVSNSDSTLTISPTTGAVVGSLNLGHSNVWTVLQTFGNASTTQLSSGTNTFYVASTGQVNAKDVATSFSGILSPLERLTLSTGTTTAWTATTSTAYIAHATAPFAGTIETAQCSTDTSFLGIDISVGSTHLAYFVASTTVGTITFTTNNTFTNGQQINMSAGTTTTSGATNVNCTLNIIQTT